MQDQECRAHMSFEHAQFSQCLVAGFQNDCCCVSWSEQLFCVAIVWSLDWRSKEIQGQIEAGGSVGYSEEAEAKLEAKSKGGTNSDVLKEGS